MSGTRTGVRFFDALRKLGIALPFKEHNIDVRNSLRLPVRQTDTDKKINVRKYNSFSRQKTFSSHKKGYYTVTQACRFTEVITMYEERYTSIVGALKLTALKCHYWQTLTADAHL